MAHFESEVVRLVYSCEILILACIGLFRIIRQALEKGTKKKGNGRKNSIIYNIVDKQLAVMATNIAQDPTKEGEKMSKLFITSLEVTKSIMKKVKAFFSKYKGYLLTVLLGILTAIETYGGFINQLFGGHMTIKGVEVLPFVTLLATMVVGLLSNGYSKEQLEKIKALFSKSSTAELVKAEIKKQLADNKTKHTQVLKILANNEAAFENLQSELESLKNTYFAKKEMYCMTPQLATEEDVVIAANAVKVCEDKIANKKIEIDEYKKTISNLEDTINALKSQL
jgi:hypothetical protein